MTVPTGECMICYDELQIADMKTCSNSKCTFTMCSDCIGQLNSSDCPQCKSLIPDLIAKRKTDRNILLRDHLVPDSQNITDCCLFTSWCVIACTVTAGALLVTKGVGWLALKMCCSPKALGSCHSFKSPLCCPQIMLGSVILGGSSGIFLPHTSARERTHDSSNT